MSDYVKASEIKGWRSAGVEIVSTDEEVDAMWGMDCISLSDEHIKALLQGECLYWENGEYATLVRRQKEDAADMQDTIFGEASKSVADIYTDAIIRTYMCAYNCSREEAEKLLEVATNKVLNDLNG